MKQLLCNQLYRMLSLFLISVFGCAGIPGTKNWTGYFQEKPNRLGDYPHLVGTPILGGVYELKEDMLLIGAPGKNRYRISNFGLGGFPRTPEEFHNRKESLKEVYGVMESGIKLLGFKVERYVSSSPSVLPGRE